MNEIQSFRDEQFGELRTVTRDGEIWFVAVDVCKYFGVSNRNRLMQHLDEDEKGGTQIDTPGGQQEMTIVSESGLYTLLFYMQPEKARGVSDEYIRQRTNQLRAFRRWVTHEVLPSIRKHGAYALGGAEGERVIQALGLALKREQELSERLQKRINAMGVRHARALQLPEDVDEALPEKSARMYIDTIRQMLESGAAYTVKLAEGAQGDGNDGLMIGYEDGSYLYAIPKVCYDAVARALRAGGTLMPLSDKTLNRCLKAMGYILPDPSGRSSTRVKKIDGASRRLLWVPIDAIRCEQRKLK